MSIYHLHIPRTSGIYTKKFLLPELTSRGIPNFMSNRSEITEDSILKAQVVAGHFGRMPLDIMDSPSVYTILRDPIEQFISYFKYTTGINMPKNLIDEKLDLWLYGTDIQHNMQSKFLTGSINIDKFNGGYQEHNAAVDNCWYIENWSLDIDDVKKSLVGINYYTLDNLESFKKDFNADLKQQFGFEIFSHNYKMNSNINNSIIFTDKQIERIKEITSIDREVYEYAKATQKRY